MEHVSVLEPTSEARHGPELRDACQHRSPPRRRGGVRCRGTCGSVRALLDGVTGSGASNHVAAPKPSYAEGQVQSFGTCDNTRALPK
jgi:hypothetical protein